MQRNLSPLQLTLFALLVALLGCSLPGRRQPAEETPGFPTATPGGQVSVSLLTPTPPNNPGLAPSDLSETTPIGPIATATAAAEAANAATATARALEARTFNPPATCPDQGNPVAPARPPTFEDYPEAIAEYLSLGGPPTILEATLRKWYETSPTGQRIPGRDFAAAGGLVRADRDFNADGVPEILLVLPDPGSIRQPPAGDLLLFGCQDAVYHLVDRAGYTPGRSLPLVASADDLLNRGYNQLIYVTETCGTTTCTREVTIRGYNLALGTFVNLSEEVIDLPGGLIEGPGVTAGDISGDGVSEIVVSSGISATPDAGPPRPTTEVWTWNGEAFALSQTVVSEPVYRIHVLHDGDAALERGDFTQAAADYARALADPELQDWTLPNESDYLKAYTLYRLMLTYAVQYQQGQAGDYFDQLLTSYPPFGSAVEEDEEEPDEEEEPLAVPGGPGSVYSDLAIVFWDSYLASNDHGLACRAAVAFAQSRPDVLVPLNSFGYANRQYVPEDLCPFISQ